MSDEGAAKSGRPRKGPAAALLILWATGWTISGVARLIDGPRLAIYSSWQIPFGPLQYAETIAGLLIAIGVGWAGVRLGRDRRIWPAVGALGALILHRALISLHWGADAWLRVGIESGVLPDIFCAGALIWFIYSSKAPAPEGRRISRVVDLALLMLVGRDALRLLMPPIGFDELHQIPQLLGSSPVYIGMGILGMVLGIFVCALALARISGARIIAPAASALLGASMFYVFMLLGTIGMGAGGVPGVATKLSLYAIAVVHLIERGILLSAIEGKQRDMD